MDLVPNKPERRSSVHVRGQNRLLTLLEGHSVLNQMQKVSLTAKTYIARTGEPIKNVFFPLTGVVSFVLQVDEGPSVEVGTVGNEGFTHSCLLVGADVSAVDSFVQVAGKLMKMPVSAFITEVEKGGSFAKVVRRAAQGYLFQVTQSVACGHAHPLNERLARWILMTHDRVGENTMTLTQEFLALMLGVQRPSVTIAASTLQHAGLIRYRRGVIDVVNRRGLERAACECYEKVRSKYEALLC